MHRPEAAVAPLRDAPDESWPQRYESTDVHDYCANLRIWNLDYDQLSAGPFQGSLSLAPLGRAAIFREFTNRRLRQRGTLGADCLTIAAAWRNHAAVRINGIVMDGAHNFIMSHNADLELYTPEEFEVRGVSASARTMQALAEELRLPWSRIPSGRIHPMQSTPTRLARFRDQIRSALEAVRAAQQHHIEPCQLRAIEDAVLIEMLDLATTAEPLGDTAATQRKRMVDRACALMLDSDDQHLTLLDVCRHVGASPRKLNYCFKDQIDQSPASFWKLIRLNRVRKDLVQTSRQRSDIFTVASRHGFWHFSQFSQDYRRHFAERPSDTVRKALVSAAPPFRTRAMKKHAEFQ